MSISSSSSDPSARRASLAMDYFRVYSASSGLQSHNRLQRPRQLLAPKSHDIATSISCSGWVAACSSKQIRLYDVKGANKSRHIQPKAVWSISMIRDEKIRGIALSEDLLAVITHNRLLVYDEYRTNSNNVPSLVKEQRIDQDGYWTPRSVSISQHGRPPLEGGATASIAVGGVGDSAVRIFRYVYTGAWNVQDDRVFLKCPQNNGAIKVVGFSPSRSDSIYGPMVFALTTGNHLYCWIVARNEGREQNRRLDPCWHLNCNARSNERVSNTYQGLVQG
jgi:hypothetical protein